MKELAIFDFDGTLFDSVVDVEACFNEVLSANGFPTLTRQEYIDRLGGNIDEAVSLILNDNSTPENIELVKSEYEKIYSKSERNNTRPFPGMEEILEKLHEKNVILAINSNRKTSSIEDYVGRFFKGIDFLSIEGHNPDYPSKPHPYGIEKIIGKSNVSLGESLYIGDSSTDIKTAKNAGIDCILVEWGYGNQSDYEDDYILEAIGAPSQILKYF